MAIWTKQGVVITPNTHDLNGGNALSGTEEPNVLYEASANPSACGLTPNPDGKIFKMWFTGGDDICYAESNDGLTWHRYTGTTNGVVIANFGHSRIYKNGSGTYFFFGDQSPANFPITAIALYTSSDGLSWSLSTADIGISLGSAGTWNAYSLGQLMIADFDGTTYYGVVEASKAASAGPWSAGLYTTTDATLATGWTPYGSNPIITVPAGANSANHEVRKIGSTYYFWSGECGGGTGAQTSIKRRTSSNLHTTSAASDVFPITTANEGYPGTGGFNGNSCTVEVNGITYRYYTSCPVNNGSEYQVEVATANMTLAQVAASDEGIVCDSLLFEQNVNGSAVNAVSTSRAYDNVTVGGSLLIASVIIYKSSGSPTFVSLSDTLGNTWTQVGTWESIYGGTFIWGIFCAPNSLLGGANTVTLTAGAGTSSVELSLLEYYGALLSSPVDTSSLTASSSSGTTLTTPSIATSFPNETLVALGRTNTGSQASASAGLGFTLRNTPVPNNQYDISSDANEASTGNYSTTFTVASTGDWIAGIVGLKSGLSIPQTYEITGNAGIAGATISWTGTASGSTTADSSGNFNTGPLANGSYTLTPSKTGYSFSPASASETVNGTDITGVSFTATQTLVATPTFSPAAGAYGPTQNVTISDTDHTLTGFQIYYTTNGDTPDNTKTAYTYGTTVAIASSCTLKAIAYATGYANSAVGSAAYTINGACGTPTFSPAAGTYTSAQTVTISSTTASASIYWNTTGSPTSSDTLYAGPITVSTSETVYAIAEKTNFSNSAVGSAAYVINTPSPSGGSSNSPGELNWIDMLNWLRQI